MSKNICSLCGKSYEYQVSVRIYPNGKKECKHDIGKIENFFSRHEKRIQKGLPKSQIMVKDKSGISHICDVERKR